MTSATNKTGLADVGMCAKMWSAWRWRQPPDVQLALDRQVHTLVTVWVRVLMAVLAGGLFKAYMQGTLLEELPYTLLQTAAYILMALSSLWPRGIPTWKVFMPLVPVCHALGYLVMSFMSADQLRMWRVLVTSGGDALLQAVLIPMCDQNSLPYSLLVRVALAYWQGQAHKVLCVFQHPALCAYMQQALNIFIMTAFRCYHLAAVKRAALARAGTAQTPSKGGPVDGSKGGAESASKGQLASGGSEPTKHAGPGSCRPESVLGAQPAAPRASTAVAGSAADRSKSGGSATELTRSLAQATVRRRQRVQPAPQDAEPYTSVVHYPVAESLARLDQQLRERRMRRAETRSFGPVAGGARMLVTAKIHSMLPSQLPATLPGTIQEHTTAWAPVAELSSVHVRHGCAVVTVELLLGTPALDEVSGGGRRTTTTTTAEYLQLINEVVHAAGCRHLPPEGSPMELQVADCVTQYQWDSATRQYHRAPVRTAATEDPLQQLQHLAAECNVMGAVPVVHCLASGGSQTLVLTLRLQLPRHSQLLGWRPLGLPAHTAASIAVEPEAGEAAASLIVMVLVRRQGGAYLPVSVTLGSEGVQAEPGSSSCVVDATVEVTLPGSGPQGLDLQLWCQGSCVQGQLCRVQGPELLCAHCPLVVLPEEWQAAATELQQHVTRMGGVTPQRVFARAPEQPCPAHSNLSGGARFLDSVSTWLSHAAGHANTGPVPPAAIQDMQTSLLLHVVLRGLEEVAALMVAVMTARDTASADAPAVGALSGAAASQEWFARAADDTGSQASGSQVAVTSLLHAAMESGSPGMLEKVLRWGQLYGGCQWQWRWSQIDQLGCTALHHAAHHRECGVSAALLATLARMLPHSEVQAARHVWFHGTGTVNVTPAQLFNHLHPEEDLEPAWVGGDTGDSKQPQPPAVAAEGPRNIRVSDPRGMQQPPAALHTSGAAPTAPATSCSAAGAAIQSWARKRRAQGKLYDAWVTSHCTPLVYLWGRALLGISLVACLRAWQEGTLAVEWPMILTHSLGYLAITAISLGARGLGTWQTWMPVLPLGHSLGFLYLSMLPREVSQTLWVSVQSGVDVVYHSLITSVCDQNRLWYMVVSRLLCAVCHVVALRAQGVLRHPVRTVLLVHSSALAITSLVRYVQVRRFHRQDQDQDPEQEQEQKSRCKTSAASAASLLGGVRSQAMLRPAGTARDGLLLDGTVSLCL